jgi:hypothetical protein
MRLHRINIKNFRSVDRFTLTFDIDGVTIIEGDNEIGKSCIPEALNLVLETLDSAKTKQIKAVKPVHRDAGPEVEVEISTGDYRFVLAKRWLKQPSTTLSLSSPKREQLTGREAHERVQAILAETLDHDLWAALNVQQGGDLALPNFNVPALGRALDAASGGAVSTPHAENLWERIQAERDLYWTPGGQSKAHRIALADRVTEARDAVKSIESEIAQMDIDVAEVDRLNTALPELERQLEGCQVKDAELAEQGRLAELAVAELRAASIALDAATSAHERAAEKVEEREALAGETERNRAHFDELQSQQDATAPSEIAARTRHDEARLAVEYYGSVRDAAEQALRLAARDTEHMRQKIEVEQFTERLDHARTAEALFVAAEEVAERIRVTAESLAEIEGRHLDFVRAEAALDFGSATLTVEALSATRLTIDGDNVELASGTLHEVSVPGALDVEVPGIVRMSVVAGNSAQDLAAESVRLQERYLGACRDAGVTDVIDARTQLAERQTAEKDAVNAQTAIQAALRDLTPDTLAKKIENLGTNITQYEAERAAEPALPETHDDAQTREREAQEVLAENEDNLAGKAEALDKAAAEVQRLGIDMAVSGATLAAAEQSLEQLEQRLTEARDQITDAKLEADIRAAEERSHLTSIAFDEANRKVIEVDPDLLSDLIDNAKAATKRIAADISTAADDRTRALARLSLRGNDGLQHQLDTALTELRHLEYEHDSLELRAETARLLHDVVASCREDIRRRYHSPFRHQIERLGRILLGDTFEVELDDDLRIAKRTLNGVTLDFEQLSAGAREQLGIVARLACATIVCGDGGAPVVLDDTLGWTDPTRLGAMGAIIAIAGKGCQVIVLTCTPGRYASIGDARIVRLPTATTSGSKELVDV